MNADVRCIEVNLDQRGYRVLLGSGILSQCVSGLDKLRLEKDIFVISDSNVYPLYGIYLEDLLGGAGYRPARFIMPAGEKAKSWRQAGAVLGKMLAENLGRKSGVIALGGGVVGDLAGLAAALYRRGVPLIHVPTTLLAQVDSSIGGKTAVNHPLGKNMIGTFYQPAAVWADFSTLASLPQDEWVAGLAEVLKYAVIRDNDLFCLLEEQSRLVLERNQEVMADVIARCCRIKAEIVSADEKDEGLRNILNFGHTIGHALESATRFKGYKHGEAVAVGMVGALELAVDLGLLDSASSERTKQVLRTWRLPVAFPSSLLRAVRRNLYYDKKVTDKELVFVLPVALGEVIIRRGIPEDALNRTLEKLTGERT